MGESNVLPRAPRAALVATALSLIAAAAVAPSAVAADTKRAAMMLGQEVAPQPAPRDDVLPRHSAFAAMPGPFAVRAEPSLAATPRASCGPGSHPEPGMQGRVPPGPGSAKGFTC